MPIKVKIAISVIASMLGIIALLWLIVVIGCAVNGLTFAEQISSWCGTSNPIVKDIVEDENLVSMIFKI